MSYYSGMLSVMRNERCFLCRFTELYVEELENEGDLRILVSDYLRFLNPNRSVISGIIRSVRPSRCPSGRRLTAAP